MSLIVLHFLHSTSVLSFSYRRSLDTFYDRSIVKKMWQMDKQTDRRTGLVIALLGHCWKMQWNASHVACDYSFIQVTHKQWLMRHFRYNAISLHKKEWCFNYSNIISIQEEVVLLVMSSPGLHRNFKFTLYVALRSFSVYVFWANIMW